MVVLSIGGERARNVTANRPLSFMDKLIIASTSNLALLLESAHVKLTFFGSLLDFNSSSISKHISMVKGLDDNAL